MVALRTSAAHRQTSMIDVVFNIIWEGALYLNIFDSGVGIDNKINDFGTPLSSRCCKSR